MSRTQKNLFPEMTNSATLYDIDAIHTEIENLLINVIEKNSTNIFDESESSK